jgi:hypothetical protein
MNKRGFIGIILIVIFLLVVALAFYLIAKMSPSTQIIKTSLSEKKSSSKINSVSTLDDNENLSNKSDISNSTNNYRIIEDTP